MRGLLNVLLRVLSYYYSLLVSREQKGGMEGVFSSFFWLEREEGGGGRKLYCIVVKACFSRRIGECCCTIIRDSLLYTMGQIGVLLWSLGSLLSQLNPSSIYLFVHWLQQLLPHGNKWFVGCIRI